MTKKILPGQTIGILGGGQLGRMMAIAAKEMGFRIAVMEPKQDSPTAQVADIEIVAPYDDLDGAKKLAQYSDVITYEFENVDYEVLNWLEEHGYLPQGSEFIRITQDRAHEKAAIQKSGGQVAPYRLVSTGEELDQAVAEIGIPCVLKTRRGGYDGKGQVMIRNKEDVQKAKTLLDQGLCIVEQFVDFDKEISVIVSRGVNGETNTFPVAENIHVDHILHESIVPARISKESAHQAEKTAVDLAQSIGMVGTLAVEMFLTKDGEIFINELAPRPHNSGHYTIDACETSQFQQHIRAICGWPLGKTDLLKPVVMVNILGKHLDEAIEKIDEYQDSKLHLYGKDEAKEKRKMGHLNVLADCTEEALEKIDKLGIWQ